MLADAVGALTSGVEMRDTETILRVEAGQSLILAQCAPELEHGGRRGDRSGVRAAARRGRLARSDLDRASRGRTRTNGATSGRSYFRALRVGRNFVIRPSWDAPPAAPTDRVIDIDPGRAFGTGGHASTRLVIAMAEELAARKVERFVDLGCGSGILSIAAVAAVAGRARAWRWTSIQRRSPPPTRTWR